VALAAAMPLGSHLSRLMRRATGLANSLASCSPPPKFDRCVSRQVNSGEQPIKVAVCVPRANQSSTSSRTKSSRRGDGLARSLRERPVSSVCARDQAVHYARRPGVANVGRTMAIFISELARHRPSQGVSPLIDLLIGIAAGGTFRLIAPRKRGVGENGQVPDPNSGER
jgi:hypothetical protein